jgi:hypothetical protein
MSFASSYTVVSLPRKRGPVVPDSPDYLRGVEDALAAVENHTNGDGLLAWQATKRDVRAALMPKAPTLREVVAKYFTSYDGTPVENVALLALDVALRNAKYGGVADFLRDLRAAYDREKDAAGEQGELIAELCEAARDVLDWYGIDDPEHMTPSVMRLSYALSRLPAKGATDGR